MAEASDTPRHVRGQLRLLDMAERHLERMRLLSMAIEGLHAIGPDPNLLALVSFADELCGEADEIRDAVGAKAAAGSA